MVYKKLTHIEHVLLRPHMYIGSTRDSDNKIYVLSDNKLELKEKKFKEAILKLFDEAYTNAIDHYTKKNNVTDITVNLFTDKPIFSIKNNGTGIKIYETEYGVWSPELIFSNLLTGGNYDDTNRKGVGGLNGLGIKLLNIFSENFSIETVNNGKIYKQKFSKNNTDKTTPVIEKTDKKDYTQIISKLDLTKFPDTNWNDYIDLFLTRIHFTAVTISTPLNIKVNVDKTPVANYKFKNSKKAFETFCTDVKDNDIMGYTYVEDYNICFCNNSLQFVNGVYNSQGGKPTEDLYKYLLNYLKKSTKHKDLSMSTLKSSVKFIVSVSYNNPEFSNQSKDKCVGGEAAKLDFKLTANIQKKINDSITYYTNLKDFNNMKQKEKKKTNNLVIENLDDAKYAGTKKSELCTLYLTEGLSAKTFAVSGVSALKDGRQYNGIFPLKGKLLNVSQSSMKKIGENTEIVNIKKILGLQVGKIYKDTTQLRYSKVNILADADVDAYHISGLIINFFHHFWPDLLKIDFLRIIRTPLIKVWQTSKSKPLIFYTENEFEEWKLENNTKIYKKKYYKGLGSSTNAEAKEIFKDLESNSRILKFTNMCKSAINLAFQKENNRKEWVKKLTIDNPGKDNSFANFINVDLRSFSIYDNIRSIPDIADGFKVSQRKVLWTMLKKNYPGEIKVAQLGAAVAELTDYHHGENSLYGAIISLAQNYTGSNNVPLLQACGNFGTHLENGEDAASPRYIFTKLSQFSKEILDVSDLKYIQSQYSGETEIEPKYLPNKFPIVLLNGIKGIGTGFSTEIMPYNIDQIKQEIEYILKNDKVSENIIYPEYIGFNGKITYTNSSSFTFTCKYYLDNKGLNIVDLPISKSVTQYKKFLTDKGYKFDNLCTDEKVHFIISDFTGNPEKELGLSFIKKTSNMVLWNNGSLKKYDTPNEIVYDWVQTRRNFIKEKKKLLLSELGDAISYLEDKMKYIQLNISGKIDMKNMSTEKLVQYLSAIFKQSSITKLLELKLTTLNINNVELLKQKISKTKKEIKNIENMDDYTLFKTL